MTATTGAVRVSTMQSIYSIQGFESYRLELSLFIDTYHSTKDLVKHASSYGFEVRDRGCCGVGRNNGQITCLPLQHRCDDQENTCSGMHFMRMRLPTFCLLKRLTAPNQKPMHIRLTSSNWQGFNIDSRACCLEDSNRIIVLLILAFGLLRLNHSNSSTGSRSTILDHLSDLTEMIIYFRSFQIISSP
ncbi:hypothetical protein RJ641_031492 [Dillenia turbinata]|uniref:Uncharacterized protein n=1 Tax=Dillenia turbinata TaxID=194707 RepID=A0AAN8VUF2_9MAGN